MSDYRKYWWVNQNQTYKHERAGGYLWSPKTKSNGVKNPFYDTMTQVQHGDIVFSFKSQHIPSVGIIKSKCYEATKPAEFGTAGANWTRVGWKVDVEYVELSSQIRPKDHIEVLKSVLPDKYSPLTLNGDGKQVVYLANVPSDMADVLFGLIGISENSLLSQAHFLTYSEDEKKEQEEIIIEKEVKANQDIDDTEKNAVIKARRGQGLFRSRLSEIEPQCRITQVSNPNHLIASHIKPWAKCENNEERLDGNNGLMLAPQIDHLFDRGYISFADNGDLLVSAYADLNSLQKMGIEIDSLVNVGPFNAQQSLYLSYHRTEIFRS